MLGFIGVICAVLLATALTLVVLALVMPLHLEIRFDTISVPGTKVRIRPFGFCIPWISIPIVVARNRGKTDRPKKLRKSHSILTAMRFANAAPAFLTEAISRIRIDRLWGVVDIGLDNPGDTGALFGYLTPITYGLSPVAGGHLVVRPDFDGPRFDAAGCLAFRVVPITLMPPLARFSCRIWGS